MQAFVLYPFCDGRPTVDDRCAHRIHYQLRSLPLGCLTGSSDAATCLGVHSHGTFGSIWHLWWSPGIPVDESRRP